MISAIMHIIHPSCRFPSLKLAGEWDRDPIRQRGGEKNVMAMSNQPEVRQSLGGKINGICALGSSA